MAAWFILLFLIAIFAPQILAAAGILILALIAVAIAAAVLFSPVILIYEIERRIKQRRQNKG